MITGFVILEYQYHVLLGHHKDGFWRLPGGKGEPGETSREAAVREVWEEVSIRLSGDALVPFFKRNEESTVFSMIWSRLPTILNTEKDKFTHWAWFPIHQVDVKSLNTYERELLMLYKRRTNDRCYRPPFQTR